MAAMVRRHGQFLLTWTGLSDLVATALAFGGAYVLRFVIQIVPVTHRYLSGWYLALLPAGLLLAMTAYAISGLYRPASLAGRHPRPSIPSPFELTAAGPSAMVPAHHV